MKIGDTVWLLARYGKRPDAISAQVTNETKLSWILPAAAIRCGLLSDDDVKFPKRPDKNGERWTAELRHFGSSFPEKYRIFAARAELDAVCDARERDDAESMWLGKHRYNITARVSGIGDVGILTQIARLIGYSDIDDDSSSAK